MLKKDMSQVIGHLPSMPDETLNSNPSTSPSVTIIR
jgi:hypothetical protein